jgi:hypothetical protein
MSWKSWMTGLASLRQNANPNSGGDTQIRSLAARWISSSEILRIVEVSEPGRKIQLAILSGKGSTQMLRLTPDSEAAGQSHG